MSESGDEELEGEDEYQDCVSGHLDDFSTYDQYVDVVSCWEEFFTNIAPYFSNFYFDRFPTLMPVKGGDTLTPDFSVFVNEDYGILFELRRTFPPEEDLFDRELEQIRNYDQQIQFTTSLETSKVPATHDIVLLVSTTDSQTIEHRLHQFIDEGRLSLDRNLIPMEYTYMDQDRKPKYQFKRLSMVDMNFRDEVLPEDWKLSEILSMKGGTFDSIYSPVEDWYEFKATGVLCNDRPAESYLACYMWQKVFSDYLTEEDKRIWERVDPKETIRITVEVGELVRRMNDQYVPDCSIDRSWIKDALEFLVGAGVADVRTGGKFEIKYRNLHEKRRKFSDVVTARTEIADLVNIFTNWYCENKVKLESTEFDDMLEPSESTEDQESEVDKEAGQAGLTDFIDE